MIHSVPAPGEPLGCATAGWRAAAGLRGLLLGYSGFRSATGRGITHRLLPLTAVVLVVDFSAADGVVTGARIGPGESGTTRWGHGVTVGFTPAGVRALLGLPMRELTGRTVRLSDLVGARSAELSERLAAARDWPGRVAGLDHLLAEWAGAGRAAAGGGRGVAGGHGVVGEAWRRLHRAGGGQTVGPLAGGGLTVGRLTGELGVGRRGLEREFRAAFGLSPGAVGRIVRFQRAMDLLAGGAGLASVAAGSGFADQAHFNRESRVLTGATPGELRAVFRSPAQSFKTGAGPGS